MAKFKDETSSVKGGETPKLDRSSTSKQQQLHSQEVSIESTKETSKDIVTTGPSKTKAKAPPPPVITASNNTTTTNSNTISNGPPTQVPSSESFEKENQVPSSSSLTKSTSTNNVKRKAPAPQKPERISSNGSSAAALTPGTNALSSSSSSFGRGSEFNQIDPEKEVLVSTREEEHEEEETDEDIEACRLVLQKHRNHQHHQQITVSLGDEEDDDDEVEHEKSLSGNNIVNNDDVVVVDTSHVSIVTIDDNGKDVTIKTTSSTTSHSPSRFDDLHSEANYRRTRKEYDDEDDEDDLEHERIKDAHSSFSRLSDNMRKGLPELKERNTRMNQPEMSRIKSESADEVILVHNASDVAKEVILVSSEKNQQFVSSVEETKHHHRQQPHSSDDQLSIRTDSSGSSSGQDQLIMETRKKVPPPKNKEPKKIVHPISVEKQRPKERYSEDDVYIEKNGDRFHPASSHSPIISPSRTHQTSHPNGVLSNLQSASSPQISLHNNKQQHFAQYQSVTPISGHLRREASDAGSVGSYASLNSDKDSNLAAHDASKGSPGVILRHRKVSSCFNIDLFIFSGF